VTGVATGVARLTTAQPRAAALKVVAEAAEDWDASWEPNGGAGGTLQLGALAGLRHGELTIDVTATDAAAGGSELALQVASERWRLHGTAAGLLAVAGAGAVTTLLWPFVPAVAPIAPMGAVLAIGAWLVVLSRLRHVGFAELVADLQERLEEPPEPDGPAEA
jgi:hypothetical protein